MKVTLLRNGMLIEPVGAPDEMYLEQVLGLARDGVMLQRMKGEKDAWGGLMLRAAPPQGETLPPPAPEAPPPTPDPKPKRRKKEPPQS